jgi:hypothetical protein
MATRLAPILRLHGCGPIRRFEVAHLGRGEVVVKDDHIGVGGLDLLLELGKLALADVRGRDDRLATLEQAADDHGAGHRCQSVQLLQRVATDPGPLRQSYADQKRAFPMDREFIAGNIEWHVGLQISFLS